MVISQSSFKTNQFIAIATDTKADVISFCSSCPLRRRPHAKTRGIRTCKPRDRLSPSNGRMCEGDTYRVSTVIENGFRGISWSDGGLGRYDERAKHRRIRFSLPSLPLPLSLPSLFAPFFPRCSNGRIKINLRGTYANASRAFNLPTSRRCFSCFLCSFTCFCRQASEHGRAGKRKEGLGEPGNS